MDKNKYLDKLSSKLDALPLSELGKVLMKYERYFEDAKEEEEELIEKLGPPKILAANIIEEYFSKNEVVTDASGNGVNKKILFLILTFYIWIPLVAIVYIIESVIILLGVALALIGLFFLIIGFIVLFSQASTGLFFAGSGLILIALGIMVFLAGEVLLNITSKAISNVLRKKNKEVDYE